jgi:6-phospho-beta-glucosidase
MRLSWKRGMRAAGGCADYIRHRRYYMSNAVRAHGAGTGTALSGFRNGVPTP